MASVLHRRQFTIEWGDCDPAGIVFNSNFFVFFDQSTWAMFEKVLGVNRADLGKTYDLVGFPLVDVRSRFLKPAKFGELVEIESEVSEFRRSSFDVQHRLTVKGELAAEGTETRVWAGRDPDDPGKMKAKPIPQAVIERFATR
ncbi:MAG TPA: thioesterase family protein [Xanthobacteraceae bacterium]